MKKTLVALAAIAATSAFAQSSVTLYGIVDVGYGITKSESAGVTTRKTSGMQDSTTAGNRIGFRGTEDLGGGLKASFVIEQGFTAINSGNNGIFGNRSAASGHADSTLTAGTAMAGAGAMSGSTARQTFVSLASNSWGEIRAGYQINSAYQLASFSGYLGGYEGASGSDIAHLHGVSDVGGVRSNGFTYLSPKFNGFDVVVQWGGGATGPFETNTALGETATKRASLQLNYANGPFKASLLHTRAKNSTASVASVAAITTAVSFYNDYADTGLGGLYVCDSPSNTWPWGGSKSCTNYDPLIGSVILTPSKGATAASSATASLTQLGASYNFGVASVSGLYNTGDDGKAVQTDKKSYQLGVKVPFGAATVFGTWGKAESESAGVTTADIKQHQYGVEYAFSKRTMVYAATGQSKDTKNMLKGSSTRFGVRHTF